MRYAPLIIGNLGFRMKRGGSIALLSAALFVASTAYAQIFDGEWRGSGGCGIGNIDRYTITLSVQNASVVGTASSFGQKSGFLPDGFTFRGQIDSANGLIALSESANRYDGKVSGRQIILTGSAGGMPCRYTLAYAGAPQVAAGPPNPQPAAPAPAVQDRANPAAQQPAMGQFAPDVRSLPTEAAKPSPPTDPARTAFIGQSAQEMASLQRALAVLGLYRGDLDGVYGPGTAGAIDAWQRTQGRPTTGYLDVAESDRLKQQALAQLGGTPTPPIGAQSPPIGAQSVAPKPTLAEAEPRPTTATSSIKVGTVFWLSTKGVGRTVVAVTVPQAGIMKIDYRITPANAAEVCQRQDQLQSGTTGHRACVEETLSKNGRIDSLLVNCGARTITTSSEVYQRSSDTPLRRDGNEGFWWGTTNKNYLLKGDEVFRLSCGQVGDSLKSSTNPVTASNDQSVVAAPPPPSTSAPNRIEWTQLLGTWVPRNTYTAERCSGKSPYPPPDNYIGISQSSIALYEGGCNIAGMTRISETTFRVSMRCGEFNDRSVAKTQTIGMSDGMLFVDNTPYVRCTLPGFSPAAPLTTAPQASVPTAQPPSTPPAPTVSFRDLGDIQSLERSRITETANPSLPIEVLVLVAAEGTKVVLGCTNVGARPDEARPSVYVAGPTESPTNFRWGILKAANGKRELFGDEIRAQTVKTSSGDLVKLELSEGQRAELSVIVGGYRSNSDGFYVVWRSANELVGFKLNPLGAKVRQEYFNMIMSCSPGVAATIAAEREQKQQEAMLAELVNNACPCRGWFQMAERLGFPVPNTDKSAIDEASRMANRIRSGPEDSNRAWREESWASECSTLIANLVRQAGNEPNLVRREADSCRAIASYWRTLKKQ